MNQSVIEEEEATPRFLLSPEPGRADAVAAVLEVLCPAGMLLRVGRASAESLGGVQDLRGLARTSGVACLVEDDVDLALQLLADGVQLGDIGDVRNARERLNEDHLIGASTGLSRHDAMTAGENGADYVTFGNQIDPLSDEIIDLVQWWRSTTVLPCLAYASNAEDVARLRAIGTDFIGIASAIWDHPDGPVAAAHLMQRAIEIR